MTSKQSIFSLYRTYLRQVRLLPHHYLRQFFRVKASDDFRAIIGTRANGPLRQQKIKRVSKDLRRIVYARNGRVDAFNYILDLAYGRRGKLKWEIMTPLLSDPAAPLPPRIIPAAEKSRPPVYSPELTALLTNEISRTRNSKALDLKYLKFPPILSVRADPSSDEARTLGPLSKRLELNTRWRYFTREWKKVFPAAQVVVKNLEGTLETDSADIAQAGIRGAGFQGMGLLEEIEEIVGPLSSPLPVTRRERLRFDERKTQSGRLTEGKHPSRWIRRRYQALLGRLPVLVYNVPLKQQSRNTGRYNVALSNNAVFHAGRMSAHRRVDLDDVNRAWLERSLDRSTKEKLKT